jgi:hypothetical protein
MPRVRESALPRLHEGWSLLVSESQEGSGGLASPPLALLTVAEPSAGTSVSGL